MRHFFGGVETVSEWSGKVLSYIIFFIVVILLYEITSRYVFNAPTTWAHELTKHMFGMYSVLMGAYVLLHNQHIKIDVVWGRFSPRGRAALDSFSYLFFFLFVVGMLVWGIPQAALSIKTLEVPFMPFKMPIYLLKTAIPIAALLIFLQGLANWLRALSLAIRGKELT